MQENKILKTKNVIIISGGISILPSTRELFLMSLQYGYEIYINCSNSDIEKDEELSNLLAEYNFNYNLCPDYLNAILPSTLSSECVIIFKDCQNVGFVKDVNNTDILSLLKQLNANVIDESSRENKICNLNNNNDNGIKDFVKRKYPKRKNRY